ncbi:MAG: phosphomannomutase/phosphoglucomutase [Patescibacteria group bacterium]|nr:phosphomannomutase/phosphoglucomutase [Patescibacteria group bacterium]
MGKINEGIFKAYDIRGVFGQDFDTETAKRVGRAMVKFTGAKTVVVGRDMRKSSPELCRAVIDGIISSGADVVNIGECSTPTFNFALAEYDLHDAGIMITASHNPAKYNGFKLCYGDSLPIGKGSGMDEIKELVMRGGFEDQPAGNVVESPITEEYIKKIFSFVNVDKIKPLKIVIDAGNGMAGPILKKIFKRLPQVEVTPMFFEPDGTFPNHEANPIKEENLRDLKEKVKEIAPDLGIAFDGDCDRVGFVDERGETISGDFITALLAKEILKKYPGAIIHYDLRSSWAVRDTILENGGKPEMCMVGHALIKKLMRQTGAVFAGELSSHFYFKDFYGVESGDLTMLYILTLLSGEGKNISELVAPLKKYFHSGEINFEVDDKEGRMRELEEKYSSEAKDVSHIDGIRLEFEDWWFNVRASNTEPLLRLNLEAKTKELMEEKRDEISKILNS